MSDDFDPDVPGAPSRHGWVPSPPPPRVGDHYTAARIVLNEARLVMPEGAPRPDLLGSESTEEKRVIIADFLREHSVDVPDLVPARFGWADCYTGALANPAREPGAEGRTHS